MTDQTENSLPAPAFDLPPDSPLNELARLLWRAHRHMRAGLRRALVHKAPEELSAVAVEARVDVLYGIDEIAEHLLLSYLEAHQNEAPPFLLVGEFAAGESLVFGRGEARYRVLCDPVDGTRLVMFGKASGWILSGIFPEQGEATRLTQAMFALQTEIPLTKHLYADTMWAVSGSGAHRLHENLLTGETRISVWRADNSSVDLTHGFVSFVNLFQHGKTLLAGVAEEFLESALGADGIAPASVFEDQHLSTGGQLYALAMGQLRMVVDARPNLNRLWRRRGGPAVLCAHPYDMAAWLIAKEAGVVVLSETGAPFDGAATAADEIGWIGFAHPGLAQRYLALLLQTLQRHDLL